VREIKFTAGLGFGSSPAPAQLSWVRLNKGWRQLLDEADPDAKEADYEV